MSPKRALTLKLGDRVTTNLSVGGKFVTVNATVTEIHAGHICSIETEQMVETQLGETNRFNVRAIDCIRITKPKEKK